MKLKYAFIFLLITFIITGCNSTGNDIPQKTTEIPDTAILSETDLVSSYNKFGFKLYEKLIEESKEENIFISPTSIAMALSMTYNGAEGITKEENSGLENELEALTESYNEARTDFMNKLGKAETEQERWRLREEEDPDKIYPAKFQKLAEKAEGTETEVKAYIWAVNSAISGKNQEKVREILDIIFTSCKDSSELANLASIISYGEWSLGQDKSLEILSELYKKTNNSEVKASALYYKGRLLNKHNKIEEAYEIFKKIREDFKETSYKEPAERYIYEIENLQIGMTAPDFSATDQYMLNFNLSDYRGKVLLIHFWGFW